MALQSEDEEGLEAVAAWFGVSERHMRCRVRWERSESRRSNSSRPGVCLRPNGCSRTRGCRFPRWPGRAASRARRFNALFQDRYRLSRPNSAGAERRRTPPRAGFVLRLAYRQPYGTPADARLPRAARHPRTGRASTRRGNLGPWLWRPGEVVSKGGSPPVPGSEAALEVICSPSLGPGDSTGPDPARAPFRPVAGNPTMSPPPSEPWLKVIPGCGCLAPWMLRGCGGRCWASRSP